MEIAGGGGDSDTGDDGRIGLHDLDPGTRVGRDVNGGGIVGEGDEDGEMGLEADSGDVSEIEDDTGDLGATTTLNAPTPRRLRSAAGKRAKNQKRARRRRVALEQRTLETDGHTSDVASGPTGLSH